MGCTHSQRQIEYQIDMDDVNSIKQGAFILSNGVVVVPMLMRSGTFLETFPQFLDGKISEEKYDEYITSINKEVSKEALQINNDFLKHKPHPMTTEKRQLKLQARLKHNKHNLISTINEVLCNINKEVVDVLEFRCCGADPRGRMTNLRIDQFLEYMCSVYLLIEVVSNQKLYDYNLTNPESSVGNQASVAEAGGARLGVEVTTNDMACNTEWSHTEESDSVKMATEDNSLAQIEEELIAEAGAVMEAKISEDDQVSEDDEVVEVDESEAKEDVVASDIAAEDSESHLLSERSASMDDEILKKTHSADEVDVASLDVVRSRSLFVANDKRDEADDTVIRGFSVPTGGLKQEDEDSKWSTPGVFRKWSTPVIFYENKQTNPEENQENPEENQENPEEKQEFTEEKQANPEEKQVNAEEKQANPEESIE